MEYVTKNLNETYELAEMFVSEQLLPSYGKEDNTLQSQRHATVVGLFGNLGAGKTSFTQGIAKSFGIRDYITSPTFVLEKIYKLGKEFPYERLVHMDAYRLEDHKEMSVLGFEERFKNPKNIIFIEWPERVEDALPKEMIKIYFEAGEEENERRIKILW